MKKSKIFLSIILFAAGAAVLFLLIAAFEAREMCGRTYSGQRVKDITLQLFRMAGADSCNLQNVRFTPSGRLEIDSLYVNARLDGGRSVETFVSCLKLEYRTANILQFVIANREAVVPLLMNKKNVNLQPQKKLLADILKMVSRLEFDGKHLRVDENGTSAAIVNNYRYKSTDGTDLVRGADGSISADSIIFGRWTLSRVNGRLYSEKGRVVLTDCKGSFLDGSFCGRGAFTLSPLMLDSAHIDADSISVEKYYLLIKKYQNRIYGKADISLDLEKSVLNLDSISGKGRLTGRNITVRDLPVQKAIVSLIGFPQLSDIKFDSIVTDFSLQKDYTIRNSMDGRGPIIAFKSEGWLRENGQLDQTIDGKLTREFVETLPETVSESMVSTPDNGRKFKCRVYGSLDKPKVSLSRETLKKAFSGAFDTVRKSIEKALR